MKVLWNLVLGLVLIFPLTGCIGEKYDFTPPTITIDDYPFSEELIEANIDWKGEKGEQLEKDTKDIQSFAKAQTPFYIMPGQKLKILFDSQDFAILELNVSVWKNDEEIKLDLSDDHSFSFPIEKGEYVIVVNLRSDGGFAQYVGNVVIQ